MAKNNSTAHQINAGAALLRIETIDYRLNEILALAISAKARIESSPEDDQDITLRVLVSMIEDVASKTGSALMAELRDELQVAA